MNDISGKYKGYSRVLLIVSLLLLEIYPLVMVGFFEDWTDSVAGFFAAISPTILGFVTGYFTFRLPCRFTADEKSFTISMGGTKRVFRIGEISEIRCEYRKHYEYRTKVTLTVTDCAGRTARFAEIHYKCIEYLKYEKDDEKPQLTRLCEYVNRIKESAI